MKAKNYYKTLKMIGAKKYQIKRKKKYISQKKSMTIYYMTRVYFLKESKD